MMTRSGLAARTLVVWAVKSVSVVWKVWTVTSSSLGFSFTVAWKTCVSDLLNASFCAKRTATRLRAGFISIAAFTAFGAICVTGADTRETYSPICGMPWAVFEGPTTGTPALLAMGSAAKACWDRVGPTMATTLATLMRF